MVAHSLLTDLRFSPLPLLPSPLAPAYPFAIPFLVTPLPARSLCSRLCSLPRSPLSLLLAVHLGMYPVAPFKTGQVAMFLEVAVVDSHRTENHDIVVYLCNGERTHEF